MKKVSLLAASVAFALTGCGGSDGDSSGATPGGVVITAIDGYLQHAEVWVDTDNDLLLDEGADTKLSELTNASGQYTLPNEHKDKAIFIKAVANQTIDSTRGLVASDFVIAATAGSTVINPMTNMVVEQLAGDNTLTQEEAEQNVVDSITIPDSEAEGLNVDADLIFGDYIASTNEDASALNAIGETLVDNADLDLTPEQQLDLAETVANQTDDMTDKEREEYAPVVTPPQNGNDLVVEPNNRPVHDQEDDHLDTVKLDQGATWTPINVALHFSDKEDAPVHDDAAVLNYELKELDGNNSNALTITDGVITKASGTMDRAGTFQYQIFAEDKDGALSYPLNLTVEVIAPNQAPEEDETVQAELQKDVYGWTIISQEELSETLTISGLFSDADGDDLTYTVRTSLEKNKDNKDSGFTASIDANDTISFSGTVPHTAAKDMEHLYIYADDGINPAEIVTLKFPEIKAGAAPEPTPSEHVLEDQFLHFVEHGDGDRDYMSAWCDTVYLDSKTKVMYWNIRTDNNNWECTSEDLSLFEAGPTYTVNADKTISFDGMTLDVISEDIYGDNLDHYFVSLDENGDTELYSYYQNTVAVENMIYQPVIEAGWKTRIVHTYVEGNAQELDVSAVVQEHSENYVAAEVHIGDMSCDQFEAIYPGYNMYVSASNGQEFWNLSVVDDSKDPEQPGCYIKRKPNNGIALEPGLFSIQFKANNSDEAETIVFSFNKE